MATHQLNYLVRTLTADGRVFQQTPDDRSERFPEIELLDPKTGEVKFRLIPDQLSEMQMVGDQIEYKGTLYDWHCKSALSDIQDYKDRGAIVECALLEAPHIGCGAAAMIRLLPIPNEISGIGVAIQPGDMLVLRGTSGDNPALPVVIPFSLPESIWPRDDQGVPQRPPLKLVCEREVTRQGFPPDMPVVRVDYLLGWETEIAGQKYRHVVSVI